MKVCVIGAGVAGLTCASVLHAGGLSVKVLEAGATAGGRVRSVRDVHGNHLGDLGPTWVWPPYQPVMSRWLQRLDISRFDQYEHGDACIERVNGQAPVRGSIPGQYGQSRPEGGPQAIIDALLASLPPKTVRTECPVVSVARSGDCSQITIKGGDFTKADAVVIAAPLRVCARDITFDPPLAADLQLACEQAPTWMAAQAKALIVYNAPFWRDQGYSGRIASTLGPLVEVHDHCGPGGTPAALSGFVGLDFSMRKRLATEHGEAALEEAIVAQLVRCFGQQAGSPQLVRIEDWAKDSRIATERDIIGPGTHPMTLPQVLREVPEGSALQFAVAEAAEVSPGLLEGAIIAGERAALNLLAQNNQPT